jgi:hypothetical protein
MLAVDSHSAESFAIEASAADNRVSLKLRGTGDMAAVEALRMALDQVRGEMASKHLSGVIIDIQELYLLNSTCLKALISFIYQTQSQGPRLPIQFVVAPRLGWQRRTLAALERMAPELVSIEGG